MVLASLVLIEYILENLLDEQEKPDFTFLSVFVCIMVFDSFFRGKVTNVYSMMGVKLTKAIAGTVIKKLLRVRSNSLNE